MTQMSLREFMDLGYLQEVNRQFLHPLGLALMLREDDDGTVTFGGIIDHRDDLEGMIFDEAVLSGEKVAHVAAEAARRAGAREEALGFWVQPVADAATSS